MTKRLNFTEKVEKQIEDIVKRDFDEDYFIKAFRQTVSNHIREELK